MKKCFFCGRKYEASKGVVIFSFYGKMYICPKCSLLRVKAVKDNDIYGSSLC